ncbi:MAG: hypothetical protein Ct9H90mP20_6730 [Candidatus Neomarinimicrobiota bacterium]|nr:MAG: hypothetical protein Ct9H90mP20_6730 [Candidatus Neomarinimicrobiota bacterium]
MELDTLAGVLKGEILVHNHCYRAHEMASMIDVAKEFGYKITAFHHGVEAYKIADPLGENKFVVLFGQIGGVSNMKLMTWSKQILQS